MPFVGRRRENFVRKAAGGRAETQSTHPERQLGKKFRVPTPGPETTCGVILGPHEARAGPVRAGVVRPMLPRVEGELLVVCSELPREERECAES